MKKMCQTYRASMPPSRLQLWAHSYSKGGPPAVLQWVRLSRKPAAFDHATLGRRTEKRARWFKVLKIRTRTDLGAAIHWNGLDRHRRTVMSFFDRWRALNKSRSMLARSLHTTRMGLYFALKSSGVSEDSAAHSLSLPALEFIEESGVIPYSMAWQMGRLIDQDLLALWELAKRTEGLPYRLILPKCTTAFDRVVEWEHRLTGRRYRYLKDSWLERNASSSEELDAMLFAAGRTRELLQTLSTRHQILWNAETRLIVARGEADELLEQCSPVKQVPRDRRY